MSGAFLLVTVATILFDMGSSGSIDATANADQYGASQGIAIGLLTFGGIICCYAVFVYYRRLRLLESRQPFGYHDRHGPVLLATALLVGIVMLLLYFSDAFVTAATSSPSSSSVTRPVAVGQPVVHPTGLAGRPVVAIPAQRCAAPGGPSGRYAGSFTVANH
jgi:drug/metabolite transporter (DMT)-like permease